MYKMEPVFLTANQIIRLYRSRSMASMPTQRPLLESAVASPVNQHHYTRTDDAFYLAMVLAQKVVLNHAFSDGNKRASVAAADLILRRNGLYLTPGGRASNHSPGAAHHPSSLADAHVAVASGQWDEEELARFYRAAARPLE